jgi:hypothetical protein
MFRLSVAQKMVFRTIDGATKAVICATENLNIPLDRARRVVLRTLLEQLEQAPRRILAGFY